MGRYVFKLPDIGEGMAEAEIGEWYVTVGSVVREDQPLVDILTDKATVEITSPVSGTVLSLNGAKGDKRPIGSDLVVLEVEGAEAGNSEPAIPPTAEPASPTIDTGDEPRPTPMADATFATGPGRADEGPQASPAVRRRAREMGVELQFVAGTGPAGRITMEDLQNHSSGTGKDAVGPPATGQRDGAVAIPVTGLRRKIAERLQDTKRRIPHFSYVEEIDVTALEELRALLNSKHADHRPRLTLLPFLIRALSVALPDHPQINATFDDTADVLYRHRAVHAGIATQTPNGLVVTVLRHAEALSLWETAGELTRLSALARAGKADRAELTGSTITITSLGPMGGLATTPIINQPEVAIIGVNKMIERPVVRDKQMVIRTMMNLSSSFDHRVVDGWDAAAFIQRLKELLENPATLFMDPS
jgi:2-oxoisovalerate dehydrogenase E2 component (dihydrolipoyl transacylase)